ncbi:Hypothetical predicted protein [Mytilus galloprovincialis]|uniref:Uncharacterized protein n=1 Tax=Mytilus galloprovincialis TaxID=29158 RepID=A0A8B6CDV3_MYTGA|nr:Hypothetical predicted protein [Mytilus galloprovincialis]
MVIRSEGEFCCEDEDCIANIMYLVREGADINAQDITSSSPVMLANESRTIKALLNVNESLNITNKFGQTPLILKLTSNEINTSVIQMLLEHGANVNALDNYNSNALHYLAWETAGTETLTILKQFVALSVPDKLGQLPCQVAYFNRYKEAFDNLCLCKTNVHGDVRANFLANFLATIILVLLGEPQDFNDVDVESIKNHWNESEDDNMISATEYWDKSEEMIRELEET